ncbi:MAG: hypothetical protein ACWA5T_10945 [Parvularcula sp.]
MKSLFIKRSVSLMSIGVNLLVGTAYAHNHASEGGMEAGKEMMTGCHHGMMHGGIVGMLVMAGVALFLVLGILSFLKYLFKK